MDIYDKKEPETQDSTTGIWQRTMIDIKRRVITGVITIIPISITILILYYIIKKIYQFFSPVVNSVVTFNIPILDKTIPVVLSVLLAASLLYLVGLLSATIAIKRLITIGENILARIPLIKILYLTSKQIIDTITLPHKTALKKMVAIEYPRNGVYGLAFLTGEMHDHDSDRVMVSVFLPSTPNPTTGFLLLLPKDQVYEINLTIDEGLKFLISGGIINPERFEMRPYKSKLGTFDEAPLEGEKNEVQLP